jgi:hypothetical protein
MCLTSSIVSLWITVLVRHGSEQRVRAYPLEIPRTNLSCSPPLARQHCSEGPYSMEITAPQVVARVEQSSSTGDHIVVASSPHSLRKPRSYADSHLLQRQFLQSDNSSSTTRVQLSIVSLYLSLGAERDWNSISVMVVSMLSPSTLDITQLTLHHCLGKLRALPSVSHEPHWLLTMAYWSPTRNCFNSSDFRVSHGFAIARVHISNATNRLRPIYSNVAPMET